MTDFTELRAAVSRNLAASPVRRPAAAAQPPKRAQPDIGKVCLECDRPMQRRGPSWQCTHRDCGLTFEFLGSFHVEGHEREALAWVRRRA